MNYLTKSSFLAMLYILLMTIALVVLMFINVEINKELLMLFSTSYGAVITYFFTKKKENKEGED